ncbi:thiol-disulfide oxidoreductase DCC family protein [Luteococcus sp. Sow4_B9]|uniref:thiol-disulfide oxidoreductase DCC family protein n=1 Tax=Luteococcus sp. Sow4_B9 TaxID=3438792 RepID=UPI003F99BD49
MRGTLFYDPDCGFCTRAASVVAGWGLPIHVRPMSPASLTQAGVDLDRAWQEIPFVAADATVTHGARAFGEALSTGSGTLGLVGRALCHPLVLVVAEPVYRWVARHRHQLPGGTGTCRLDTTRN